MPTVTSQKKQGPQIPDLLMDVCLAASFLVENRRSIAQVRKLSPEADSAVRKFLTGEGKDLVSAVDERTRKDEHTTQHSLAIYLARVSTVFQKKNAHVSIPVTLGNLFFAATSHWMMLTRKESGGRIEPSKMVEQIVAGTGLLLGDTKRLPISFGLLDAKQTAPGSADKESVETYKTVLLAALAYSRKDHRIPTQKGSRRPRIGSTVPDAPVYKLYGAFLQHSIDRTSNEVAAISGKPFAELRDDLQKTLALWAKIHAKDPKNARVELAPLLEAVTASWVARQLRIGSRLVNQNVLDISIALRQGDLEFARTYIRETRGHKRSAGVEKKTEPEDPQGKNDSEKDLTATSIPTELKPFALVVHYFDALTSNVPQLPTLQSAFDLLAAIEEVDGAPFGKTATSLEDAAKVDVCAIIRAAFEATKAFQADSELVTDVPRAFELLDALQRLSLVPCMPAKTVTEFLTEAKFDQITIRRIVEVGEVRRSLLNEPHSVTDEKAQAFLKKHVTLLDPTNRSKYDRQYVDAALQIYKRDPEVILPKIKDLTINVKQAVHDEASAQSPSAKVLAVRLANARLLDSHPGQSVEVSTALGHDIADPNLTRDLIGVAVHYMIDHSSPNDKPLPRREALQRIADLGRQGILDPQLCKTLLEFEMTDARQKVQSRYCRTDFLSSLLKLQDIVSKNSAGIEQRIEGIGRLLERAVTDCEGKWGLYPMQRVLKVAHHMATPKSGRTVLAVAAQTGVHTKFPFPVDVIAEFSALAVQKSLGLLDVKQPKKIALITRGNLLNAITLCDESVGNPQGGYFADFIRSCGSEYLPVVLIEPIEKLGIRERLAESLMIEAVPELEDQMQGKTLHFMYRDQDGYQPVESLL